MLYALLCIARYYGIHGIVYTLVITRFIKKGKTMSIQSYLTDSFGYTNNGLIGHWKRWFILIIGSIIFPIMNGYSVRVMEGKEPAPELGSIVSLFIDGLKLFVIQVIYLIIPVLVLVFTSVLAVIMTFPDSGALELQLESSQNPFILFEIFPGLIGSVALFLILAFIALFYGSMGMVRFSRTKRMGDAFSLRELNAHIRRIGVLPYILALIVIWIITIGISLLISSISFFGMEADIVSWILIFVATPYLTILSSRYFSLLYDSGNGNCDDERH